MKENNKAVASSTLLVDSGKSSRLAAIRNKVQQPIVDLNNQFRQFSKELSLENKQALQSAIQLVEQRLSEILNAYPQGKKNTFFKLKYGVQLENIRKMPMKQVFVLLKLKSSNIGNFRLIENLDFSGQSSEV